MISCRLQVKEGQQQSKKEAQFASLKRKEDVKKRRLGKRILTTGLVM
jgi:hypothetical protein